MNQGPESDWLAAPRAAVTGLLLVIWTLAMIPPQALLMACRSRAARVLPMIYHRGVCRLIGLHVKRSGEAAVAGPALFVSNHTSYIDIVVLQAALQASFVAKSEVAGWPLVGLLARLGNSLFIERRPSHAAAQSDAMRRRLKAGESLILFPEATSSDGNRLLPFRSPLFSVVEEPLAGRVIPVQPISLVYTHANNLPMSRRDRPFLTWYGGTELLPHLWQILCRGPATAELKFYPPMTITDYRSRKELASACERRIARGVSAALAGRGSTPPARAGTAPAPARSA
ncbi:MAG: lysophospholipid acyltransferase family protein [Alphaproteobacteria bacterium]